MSETDRKEEFPYSRWQALSTMRQNELRILLGPNYVVEVMNGSAPLGVVIEMARKAIVEARDRLKKDGSEKWNEWANGQLVLLLKEQKASSLQPPERYHAYLRVAACGWVNMHLASQHLRDTPLVHIERFTRRLAIMRDDYKSERRYKVLRCATELTAMANPDKGDYKAEKATTWIPKSLRKAIKERTGVAHSTSAKDLMDMGWRLPSELQITVRMS